MGSEKRQFARGNVTIDRPGIVIFLKSADGLFDITRIIDISLTGVGVETRYRIDNGERVVLKYRAQDLNLAIEGTVAWCRAADAGACALGIAFDPENREKNSVFFLALRQYLDDEATRFRLPSC